MEAEKQSIVRRILFRLGEGLIVGIGVAIVLGVYDSMSHATDELRKTRQVLEKQVEINQQLKNQIELRDEELSRLQDLLVDADSLAGKVRNLAERLRAVETASVSGNEQPLETSEFDWGQFEAPRAMSAPEPEPRETVNRYQLESLQDAINAQRKLQ